VPKDRTLRERILYAHHDTPIAGHPGYRKTIELVKRNWWWPTLTRDAARYVAACEVCQRNKYQNRPLAGPLHPYDAPETPWEVISVDLIGPIQKSNRYDAIFVIVDKLTKMVIAIPTTTKVTLQGVARLFRDHVFKRFGTPRKIISDRGPQFSSKFAQEFLKMIEAKPNLSTAYRPQTDGQTERANQEIETYLRIWCNDT